MQAIQSLWKYWRFIPSGILLKTKMTYRYKTWKNISVDSDLSIAVAVLHLQAAYNSLSTFYHIY